MGVIVKPLEWQEYDEDWWAAESPALRLSYEVRVTSRGLIRFRENGEPWDYTGGTLDEAKAAAQADYERRVLSAIDVG